MPLSKESAEYIRKVKMDKFLGKEVEPKIDTPIIEPEPEQEEVKTDNFKLSSKRNKEI